jgi:hypothetical protein
MAGDGVRQTVTKERTLRARSLSLNRINPA